MSGINPTALQQKAYSYVRFSTVEQEKGDSLRRQMAAAEAYALKHGLDLVDASYQDLGVSAYRGANADTGKLSEFIEAVRTGAVERGSYLLIESMDRLSRAKPRKAVRLLEAICEEGITVVTLSDGKLYDEDTLDEDPMAFMWAFMVAMRANEESATKARRLKSAWASKRKTASDKVLTARAPTWLTLVGEGKDRRFEVIEEKAAIVRRVFDLTLKGVGQAKIATIFNSEHVPTFDGGKMWYRSFITKVQKAEAVIGIYTPHTVEEENGRKVRKPQAKVLGYYPHIVSEDVFQEAQALISTKAPRGRHANVVAGQVKSVLAGLASCPSCGGTMTRITKGERDVYLVCTKAKGGAGCSYKSVRYELAEHAVMEMSAWFTDELTFGGELLSLKFAAEAFEQASEAVDKLVDALAESPSSPALKARLSLAEDQKDAAEKALRSVEALADQTAGPMVEKRVDTLRNAWESKDVTRVNRSLRTLMERVVVDYRTGELVFHWKHGVQTRQLYTFVVQ